MFIVVWIKENQIVTIRYELSIKNIVQYQKVSEVLIAIECKSAVICVLGIKIFLMK